MTSPGLSSVPANSEPIITEEAPAAMALTTSPENLMPPSATMGTSALAAALAAAAMAVICGMPAPETTRVVQMEPGPIPTFTAATPAETRSAAPSWVPTLPAITSRSGNRLRTDSTVSITRRVWPCAVSTTTTSTLASTSAAARSRTSGVTPSAAPTRRRPSESLQALGYLICFWMSLTVMRPLRL